MITNVLTKDLRVGDVVEMVHVENGCFSSMMVTEIDRSANGLTCTRPYLVPAEDRVSNYKNKSIVRPHVGLEEVWFSLDGSMLFNVLSESSLKHE